MNVRPILYDVVVKYVGGYRYSFSMAFAAAQAAYRTSDLVGNDFQNEKFEYPTGTNWRGVDSGLSSLRFRPADNFLLFTSLDKYFDQSSGQTFLLRIPAKTATPSMREIHGKFASHIRTTNWLRLHLVLSTLNIRELAKRC